MLAQFTKIFSDAGINISDIINKSKKDVAYTIINTDDMITNDLVDKINAVDEFIKARVIK